MLTSSDSLPFPLGTSVVLQSGNPNIGRAFEIPAITPAGVDRFDTWRVRCVKNASGVALLPYLAVIKDTTTGGAALHKSVLGYVNAEKQGCWGIVDEFLPAAGVPANEYFWLMEKGPVTSRGSATAADYNGNIAIGAPLMTAATGSGVTDAAGGRLANVDDSTPADATAAQVAAQLVGFSVNAYALEAKTANTTAGLFLVQLLGKF